MLRDWSCFDRVVPYVRPSVCPSCSLVCVKTSERIELVSRFLEQKRLILICVVKGLCSRYNQYTSRNSGVRRFSDFFVTPL